MKVEFVRVIRKGQKNSRVLVKVNHSVLVENARLDSLAEGTEFDVDVESLDDREFNESWILGNNKESDKVKKHLAAYKKDVLKIAGNGTWRDNQYDHILPDTEIMENLIQSDFRIDMEKTVKALEAEGALHHCFKHLNSSQALAINLLQPLISEDKLAELVGIPKSSLGTAQYAFEKILDEKERTQFDFYIDSASGTYSFEVKYNEPAFGYADPESDPQKYEDKWNNIYRAKLESCLADPASVSKEQFFDEYQLWRNILFCADARHTSFFVFPKFRSDLAKVVEEAKAKLRLEVAARVKILFVDDIVEKQIASADKKLSAHYAEFKRKYLDIDK